jgi:hypothetical protein
MEGVWFREWWILSRVSWLGNGDSDERLRGLGFEMKVTRECAGVKEVKQGGLELMGVCDKQVFRLEKDLTRT